LQLDANRLLELVFGAGLLLDELKNA
jgi:hypothetical protein